MGGGGSDITGADDADLRATHTRFSRSWRGDSSSTRREYPIRRGQVKGQGRGAALAWQAEVFLQALADWQSAPQVGQFSRNGPGKDVTDQRRSGLGANRHQQSI